MASFRFFLALGACAGLLACGKSSSTGTTSGGTGGQVSTGTGGAGGMPAGVTIQGLTAKVNAVYDQNGLLHLACSTDDDCFAALGYFHASNRFFFMDFVRNLVRGSLGGLVKAGAQVLAKDYANRQWFSTRDGTPLEDVLYDSATPEVKGHLDAYTRGVNAWIADMRAGKNGATLTSEYDFSLIVKSAIRDWQPQDSAAVGLYVLDDLSNNSAAELEAAKDIPLFPPALAADLFTSKPVFDAFTVPAATGMPPLRVAPSFPAYLAPQRSQLEHGRAFFDQVGAQGARGPFGEIGSNNWAVAPARTASGNALLANDPHLLLSNPSIWFAVELDAKSNGGSGIYHVAGSTFPGLPSVMVGHNEEIGWGVTTTYWDMADEYMEKLTPDGKSVVFNGQNVPIFTKDFTFQDASTGMAVTKTFEWVPHHGPIISKDTTAGTAISVRWTGHDGGTDLDAFFALARSGSVAEAKSGLTTFASSAAQNFVVIDKAGNIGWFPYSKVPNRPWASAAHPASLPVPGDGSEEWQGTVPFSALPQLLNPAKGFIATANQDMTGASTDGDPTNDSQPAIQAYDKADGTREQRIIDLLTMGGNTHSVSTMHDLQGDTYSLYGSFTVPLVVAAANGKTLTANEQAVVSALSKWKFTCPTGLDGDDPVMSKNLPDATVAAESIGCTAFHTVFYAIVREALGDEETKAGVDLTPTRVDMEMVARALHDPTTVPSANTMWDDITTPNVVETRDDILRRAITDAANELSVLGAPDEWRWGRVHTLSLRSIYDAFGLTTYNTPPVAAPGGQFTVNVANPTDHTAPAAGKAPDFSFTNGPSVRFVVEATPQGLTMTYELPGGADLHKSSPFYNNLLPLWLKNQPIDFPFGPGAVSNPASSISISPAH